MGGCEGQSFCENPDQYPSQLILKSLNKDPYKFKRLLKKSCIPQVNDIGLRFFSDETLETPLCQGIHKIIVPKAAMNTREEWKFIVNLENYTQTLDVEQCRNIRNSRSVNKEFGELEEDEFEFPAACACFFRRDFSNSLPE